MILYQWFQRDIAACEPVDRGMGSWQYIISTAAIPFMGPALNYLPTYSINITYKQKKTKILAV